MSQPDTFFANDTNPSLQCISTDRVGLEISRQWQLTVDAIPDVLISVHDCDFKIIRANIAFARFTNTPIKEIRGKTCYELLHQCKSPPVNCPHCKALSMKRSISEEVRLPNSNKILLISATPLYDKCMNIVGTVHVAWDITKQKKMEERLRLLSRLPEIDPNMIMRVEKNGKVSYLNPAARKFLKEVNISLQNIDKILPPNIRDLIHDIPMIDKTIKNVEVNVKSRILNYTIRGLAGFDWTYLYARDVTDVKKLHEEVFEKKKLSYLMTMMTGLTDLINNKIMVASGNIELLIKAIQQNNSDMSVQISKTINDHIRHISQILEYIYRYCIVSKQQCSVRSIKEDLIGLKNKYSEIMNFQFDLKALPHVYADESLYETIEHIIVNAVESNPKNTSINIDLQKFNENIMLSFKDNGPGMSNKILQKALLPFFTTKGTNKLGLGLWIVFSNINRMGGIVEIESEPGKGTTVRLKLKYHN